MQGAEATLLPLETENRSLLAARVLTSLVHHVNHAVALKCATDVPPTENSKEGRGYRQVVMVLHVNMFDMLRDIFALP